MVGHLEELRRRIFLSLLALVLATLISVPFSSWLLRLLKLPARNLIDKLAFFGPEEAFLIFTRISFFSGLFISFPFIAYQFWLFISPAFEAKLKRRAVYFVFCSSTAFITGGLFAYFILLSNALKFLLSLGSSDLVAVISAARYVSFVITIILASGLIFQMPIVILILTLFGIVNAGVLRKNFKFALIAILIFAAIITPTTDAFNLLALAIPMMLLYEISIWISYFFQPKKKMT